MAWGEGGAHGPLLLARHCAGIPEAGGLWRSGRPCRLSESPVFGKGLTGKLRVGGWKLVNPIQMLGADNAPRSAAACLGSGMSF